MAIQKKRGQQIWLDVHLYIGLTVGFIFALMGLTGRILIFLAGLILPTLCHQRHPMAECAAG